MLEDAGDERSGFVRQPVLPRVVVEPVVPVRPEREVDVPAVSGRGWPRLRRQGRDQAVLGRDAADAFADEDLLVRRTHGGRVPGRDLLLTVAQLCVVLLERDLLLLERIEQGVHVRLRRGHPDRREAEARVDWRELPVALARERELVLERRLESAALREPIAHAPEEGPRTLGRRLAVQPDQIDEDRAGARCVGEDAERLQVRNEPDLADRAHSLDGLELVEPVHCLHRDGQPDPALEPALEAVHAARLAAHGAVVAAPEEADEADSRLVHLLHYVTCLHSRHWSRRRRGNLSPADVLADRVDHDRGEYGYTGDDREPRAPATDREDRRVPRILERHDGSDDRGADA